MIKKFNTNIELANHSFQSVFNNRNQILEFIDAASSDIQTAWANLKTEQRHTLNTGVEALVTNAKITETRKMQQVYFGSVMHMLMGDSKLLAQQLITSTELQIKLLQLMIIFLIRVDIDAHGHNHDHIRASVSKTLTEIQPHLRKETTCQKNQKF